MQSAFEMILDKAGSCPERTAIWADGGAFTYGELYDYSLRVAAVLKKDGVKAGDGVAIELPRCREYLGAILGSWMLGAFFVPSDDSYPEDRKAYMAADSGSKVRVDPAYLGKVGRERLDYVASPSLGDVAFIVYTSGSTGRPKGVVHSHRSVSAFVDRIAEAMGIGDSDRFSNPAAFTFVVGVTNAIGLLALGCPDYIVPPDVRVNLNRMSEFNSDHGITMTFMAPAMLPYYRQKRKTLRRVIIGGERAVKVWSDDFEIVNGYGSSETCSLATMFVLDKPYDKTPLGRPLKGVNAYILDEDGKEAEEGEICFTGHFSSGYRNLPEATAKTFVPNPFKDRDGFDVMVRTGDLGRRLPDGSLLFLERKDWMVNINGQRVEPGEIAGVMSGIPGVVQAAVKDFEGSDGQTFLCAYYVAAGDVGEGDVRDYLKGKLPAYMVPAYLMRLDRMPMNASGKVDRRSLPDPTAPGSGSEPTAEPAGFEENAVTRGVREILKSITGRGDYRYDENLLHCGLSSLTAIKFTSEVMGRFGVDLDVTSMLGGCSVASLSDDIIGKLVEGTTKASASKPSKDMYPLTKTQLGVYVQCYANPQSVMYNIPMHVRYDAARLEGKDLAAAVRKVVEAHPCLKCTIGPDARGEACMIPHPGAEVRIEEREGSEEELAAFRDGFVRPFDLSESLYRICVFRTEGAVDLFLDFSHIMFDGSSGLIFMQDLEDALSGSEVSPERFTMLDVSDEEAERAESGEYLRAEKYFSDLLSETDGTSVVQRDVYGEGRSKGRSRSRLGVPASGVKAFAEASGATENAFFQSVMGFVMSRFCYSGRSCHATVHSGRTGGRTSRLVGMLVKTLPVTFDINMDESPGALVRKTAEQLSASVRNDIYPFTEISAKAGVSADTMFVYQGILEGEGVQGAQMEIGDAQFPLTLQVYPDGDGFLADLEYDSSMYSEGMAESIISCFGRCAEGFLSASSLRDVEAAGPEDVRFLEEVDSSRFEYDRSDTVAAMFRRAARRDPGAVAVSFKGKEIAYGELDRVTDHLASYISSKGIGRDDFVAVLVPRSEAVAVATIGVVKSGAAYQPLDPTYPEERIRFMMEDARARLLIADRSLIGLVPWYKGEVLFTDEFESRFAGPAPDVSALSPSPGDAFIILYTSGTTGKPKGCVLEHRNLVAFLNWIIPEIRLGPGSRYASYASYGFDACMMDTHAALASGAALHIIPDEIRKDLGAIDAYYCDNGITHGFMTTQMGRMFMGVVTCRTLRYFGLGGEALVPLSPPDWLDLYNLYGPTETTVCVTSFQVKGDGPMLPIGVPNRNTRLYVLDEDLRIVPTGACGELCVSGPQVFRGYLNNPEKTAAALVRNPYSDGPDHDVMYRTGDVVRLLPDGMFDYVGRRDGMVKVRGFRIELTEVERAVREYPGIKDATVQAFDAPSGGKLIAAYVVSDGKVDVKALGDFIASTKPAYMVPAVTMQLDEIPMTVNGKVDKRKLPAPAIDFGKVTPPSTDLQKRIFRIASEVLGTDRFGIETDLFQAGLTSISSIRLNTMLSEEFGIPFRSQDLKENCTVEKLESFVLNSAPAKEYPVQDDYPLTKSQEGVFVECMSMPGSTVYNIPLLLRCDDGIDTARLKAAIVKAVAAHPFMTTELFTNSQGFVRMRRKGLREFSEDEIEEVTADSLESVKPDLVQPFQLMGSRLFRFRIIHADGEYLLAEMHHIISDGTSAAILMDAISRAYAGEELEPERFSGFEAALKEEDERKGEALNVARKYYEDLLSGRDRDFLLKGDRRGPAPDSDGELSMEGSVVAEKLYKYCEEAGITVNAMMCSAFGHVLAAFNGNDHSVFATVYNGRSDSRTAGSVSMYVKTLPVVCDVSDLSMPPLRLCEAMGRQLVDSMSNDLYSFAEASRELGAKADVLFVYQGEGYIADRFCGLTSEPVPLRLSEAKEPILFQAMSDHGKVRYSVEYDRARYTPELVGSFVRAFDKALSEFMSRPTIKEVVLTDSQTEEAYRSLNDTDSPYDASVTALDMFMRNAREHTDDVALVHKGRSMTYGELGSVASRIAGYVRSKGIGRNEFVAVLVHRSPEMVFAALGIEMAGAAYQPLDPTYPEERLLFMMRDAGARLLIADRDLRSLVQGYDGDILYTDEIGSLPEADGFPSPAPEDAFVILYTSGTTGTPKGCVLEHGNLTAYLNWMIPEVGLGPGSRYASYASYGFDACMMDIHASMASGAALHIIPDEIRKDLGAIDAYYCDNGITHGFMTTQVGRMFMESTKCRSLKAFMTGGEALVPLNPSDWVDFYNIYGPTECTVNVSSFIVRDATPLIPIGRPNSNVRLYVLDKSDRLVPVGACGELCISGPQVFREYLNNPEKTAKTVVPNPLSDDPGHRRLYRTGDVVRLLPDGNVDYVGRRDGMVKVRGFRIELGEVEAAVRSFEGIKDATVQAFDAPSGGKLIAAYVVSDGKVDVKALGDFIASTKPAYMVPAVTMQLDEIPMTVNGKVDRRKLPAPAIDFGKVTPPSTDLQKRIFKIASDVLGTDGFGIETDLFQAGLTSISSIRLNTLLSEEFGIPFRSKDVKDNCTVEKLESFVLNSAPAKEYPVQDDYPLTKSQEGVFVECMSMPGSTVYNIPILVKCDDGIDTARLKAAIVKAVAAHPFVTTELFMSDSGDIRMRGKGLREFSEDEIEEVTADSLESVKPDLVQPFQLMGSRLFRFKIIHADGEYLLADLHHIISDGASTHILMDAISRAYAGEELEPERFSGFEAALKEEDERKGEALNVARKYYEDLLSGRDRDFLLKGDRRGPAPASDGELLAEGSVPAEELCRYCDGAGITVNAMMCSAFGHVLAAFNGNDHSVFATVYNGRSDSRIADSISMYVKTLPVVCDVSDLSMPPLRLCEAMGRQLVDSMSNDLYSFAEASRELGAKADVLFVYQGEGLSMDSFCGLPSEPVPLSLSEVKEPILFQVISDHGKIRYRVEYDKERYTPELIGSLVRAFDRALSEFMSSSKLKEVSLADESTEEAYRRLNDTDSPYDASVTALDRFRKNAKERPDATAVVHKGRSMTYGELGSAAGRIAGYVRSKGIGRNEFVAVLVHRSPEMVFAALGIEMAGAAYQPLDPTYPEERLLFMMRDAGARLLIADRALRGLVRSYDGDILYTDEIGSLPEADEFPSPAPEDAFVILYTSGTTGTPKGCVLEHGNLTAYLNWMIPEVRIGPGSRYASYASYGFDACMMDIHASMASGAALHIIPDEMRKDLAEVDRYFVSHGITHGFMTTQMGRMFMEETKCRSLKAFMTGGEALVPLNPPDWVDFYNIYGPTECTVNVTTFIVRDASPLIPIGRPNSNVRLYVLDKSDRLVPVGACGELCISGPQVFREYLNNPEKTAKTVTPNPLSDDPGHRRLYRTGDVVRLLPDGNVDYVGRRDGMVKVRGFRIELGEVEAAVRSFEGIKDATVQAFDDPAGGKSVTVYVVSDSPVDFAALSDHIRAEKPPYMVPAHYIQLDAIPMTVNGKVDRRKLPEPASEPRKAGREPTGPLEERLCGIFASVLGLEKVYADDDFFQIGGTSISASKLVLTCMNAGFPIVYKNVFDNPSPEALARFVENLGQGGSAKEEERSFVDEGPLASNVEGSLDGISSRSPRKVLLTGATGYLGAHVLFELLRRNARHVCCLVRSGKGQSSEERLKTMFMYYFGGMAPESVLDRVEVVDSDITDPELAGKLEGTDFDTIVNCAAVVKHFAADDSIERVNVGGVENLIGVAKDRGAMLVQISTESVAGESVNGSIPEGRALKECELDFGQNLDNKYVHSKFMAERAILEAIPDGLKAKILRVGNLMSRDSDGEFQINFGTNAFMKQMRSYVKLGFFPVTDMDTEVEFSPIDMVAKAAVLLAGTPEEFTVFHVNNCHKVHMANVLKVMRDNGMPVEVVSRKEFDRRFAEAMKDEANGEYVSGLISYLGNAGETRRFIPADDAYTVKALYRLGFSWPIISDGYMDKAFKTLKSMRFFR